jgi:hypothetical protein
VGGTTPAGPFNVPGEGPGCAGVTGSASPKFAPCIFAPNGMTNAVVFDAAGKPHFRSEFNYLDFILNNTIKTPYSRLPINALLEFEDNLGAASHALNSTGALTNLGPQNHAYLVDVSVGQQKNKNDLQVGYAWQRQEQESVIASFDESDQRAPTNILQHRIYALYKIRANTTASFTLWHGRTLNTGLLNAVKGPGVAAGATEPYFNRFFFDLIYSF